MILFNFIWDYSLVIIALSAIYLGFCVWDVFRKAEEVDEEELSKYGIIVIPVITGITYQAIDINLEKKQEAGLFLNGRVCPVPVEDRL